ncbi:MAG: hypothetical protein E7445_03235 [Ruminococcaceae bacterium]|nr:hypothetical protein [Oscillospiraceae bacterium]
MDRRLENWCDQVIGEVCCWVDHNRIREELEQHIEDRCLALEALNYPPELAAERTLAAMGDPVAVGKALNKEHSLWLGRLWIASVVAMALMVVLVLVDMPLSSGSLVRFREKVMETVMPEPYEEYWVELDENFDAKAAYGPEFDYTCIAISSAEAVDAGNWTVEIPKAVWWDRFDKFTYVAIMMTVTPDRIWHGSAFENADELLVTAGDHGEAVNLSARKNVGLGSSGFPWFFVDDSRRSFGRNTYYIGITVKGEADWVEISWPYGDQPWGLRLEKEAAS